MAEHPGREVFVEVDLNNNPASRDWQPISQQNDGNLARLTEFADATHKDDDGWTRDVPTRRRWSIDCGGVLSAGDPVLSYLKTQFEGSTKIWVRWNETFASGEQNEGQAYIEDFSKSGPEGEVVRFTCNLRGQGSLS